MKIELSFEVKPGTARRVAVLGTTLIMLGAATAVYASQVTFTSGQALTAADLNNNFNELYAKAAKPTITANGKSISIGGTYCGQTSATYDGAGVGGYAGGKAKCQTTCASATAHMCSTEEAVRSTALGIGLAGGWIAQGVSGVNGSDCSGFTSNAGSLGANWNPVGFPATGSCTSFYAINCCD